MQQGKCKLDLGKNPIIQVTPLGNLPQVNGLEKVAEWLEPTGQPANKTRRMDTREITPSTSSGVRATQPSITPKPIKTARAQIRAMASTATKPMDGRWNHRQFFNPSLPSNHDRQQPFSLGNTVPNDDLSISSLSHRSLQEGVVAQGPSEPRALDSPHSHTSRTTILAQPLSQAPSSSDLSKWAELLTANLGEPEGPSRAPGSSVSARSSNDLIKDLMLSDDSSSLPDMLHTTEEQTVDSQSESGTTVSDSASYQYRPTPTTLADPSTSLIDRPKTLSQAISDIGSDLETLVSLNKSVQPPDQLQFLEQIHTRFQSYLAPYTLYHH